MNKSQKSPIFASRVISRNSIHEDRIARSNSKLRDQYSLTESDDQITSDSESEEELLRNDNDRRDRKLNNFNRETNGKKYGSHNLSSPSAYSPSEIFHNSDVNQNDSDSSDSKCKQNLNVSACKQIPSKSIFLRPVSIFISCVVVVCCGLISIKDLELSNEKITIDVIKAQFPKQPVKTLQDIETVIDDVLAIKPIHPAVFMLIYKGESNHDKFVDILAKFASGKLNTKTDHIVLNETVYNSEKVKNDYGYLIFDYKSDLKVRRVMVLKNLHNMPGKTAQALHSFCDEYTPLVDRAVYIMSLKVSSFEGSALHIAEKELYAYWNDLEIDILAPLVTRVTSTAIKIY